MMDRSYAASAPLEVGGRITLGVTGGDGEPENLACEGAHPRRHFEGAALFYVAKGAQDIRRFDGGDGLRAEIGQKVLFKAAAVARR